MIRRRKVQAQVQTSGTILVKCNSAGTGLCKAGTPDDSWMIGYVYCDHAEVHAKGPSCAVKCKTDKICAVVKGGEDVNG